MIIIDQDKCNQCGICADICHEYCIRLEDGVVIIDHEFCSTCTQCVAVCPQSSLSWNNIRPEKYKKENLPAPLQLDELLKERRTIRYFKKKKIERELLEEVVDYAVYSPTHNFNLRAVIVDDEELIRQIDTVIYNASSRIYKYLYKPKLFPFIVKIFTPSREHEYLKVRPKLEAMRNRGRIFKSPPAAIIMIVGDERTPFSVESAQYALYSINLYAHLKGLGCRNLVGNQRFINNAKPIRKALGLNKHEKIAGTMGIGYPSLKFNNKVNGKHIDIKWK